MCFAIPVKIKSQITNHKFQIDGGRIVDTSLVPDAGAGDWLLCHADLAINKLKAKEAQEILKLNKACLHKDINVSYRTGKSPQSS